MINLKKEPITQLEQCEMCHSTSMRPRKMYEWVGTITKSKLIVCENCAKREIGSKNWKKYLGK